MVSSTFFEVKIKDKKDKNTPMVSSTFFKIIKLKDKKDKNTPM